MSISLSDLIWKVFATIMNLTDEKNEKLNFFADPILVSINCDLRLPLDKMTYFDDIIIRFNCVDKIVYREKNKLFCRCLRLRKQNHVACINKSTTAVVHCIAFPSTLSHHDHLLKYFRY